MAGGGNHPKTIHSKKKKKNRKATLNSFFNKSFRVVTLQL